MKDRLQAELSFSLLILLLPFNPYSSPLLPPSPLQSIFSLENAQIRHLCRSTCELGQPMKRRQDPRVHLQCRTHNFCNCRISWELWLSAWRPTMPSRATGSRPSTMQPPLARSTPTCPPAQVSPSRYFIDKCSSTISGRILSGIHYITHYRFIELPQNIVSILQALCRSLGPWHLIVDVVVLKVIPHNNS